MNNKDNTFYLVIQMDDGIVVPFLYDNEKAAVDHLRQEFNYRIEQGYNILDDYGNTIENFDDIADGSDFKLDDNYDNYYYIETIKVMSDTTSMKKSLDMLRKFGKSL